MTFDFDAPVDREHSHSEKFDGRLKKFGRADVMPLWVADMDFAVPECATRALMERVSHPVFGYTFYPDSLFESLLGWFARRHQWRVARDSVLMCPGVVPSLFAVILALTEEGDGVIVQPPVYPPFFSAVTTNRRRLVNNPLVWRDGRWQMDFDHLEDCARQGAKMLLLCSPHNPVGRVWRRDELLRLLEIAGRYNLLVVSDDIHCDLVYPGERHTMLANLAADDFPVITAVAPSKTFNIAGLGLSALVVPDASQRQAINRVFDSLHIHNTNPFSIAAFEAVYREGDAWLDALMAYLQDNRDSALACIRQSLSPLHCTAPEATCLLWLDCRELGLDDAALNRFFVQQCGLGLNAGVDFGAGGEGFMRLNIGTRKAVVMQALEKLGSNLP